MGNFSSNEVEPVSAANVLGTVIMPIDVEVDAVFLNEWKFPSKDCFHEPFEASWGYF